AALLEGESLLIGGISVDVDVNGRSGLPVLGKVPFLGGLFRHDEGNKVRRERLFLITPKLVTQIAQKDPVPPIPFEPEVPPAPAPSPSSSRLQGLPPKTVARARKVTPGSRVAAFRASLPEPVMPVTISEEALRTVALASTTGTGPAR
ncbi:MAG: hypothetical protein ABW067_13665, partial [Rhizobacter sp.]